jgi:transcriptional antiterminator RfaH
MTSPPIDTNPHWFLVRTEMRRENTANERLSSQGYQIYFPRISRRVRRQGKRIRQIFPLFPQYLFLQLLTGEQSIAPVRSTKGVLGIVKFGASYAIVPDRIVSLLQKKAHPETGLYHIEERRLWPNKPIRVNGGTFDGLEGIFLRDCGEDRVLILLSVLGQSTPVKIPETQVEPLAPAPRSREPVTRAAAA